MAEIADSGGGGGKHGKKGRKSGGTPRIDMTPMVDLAFLLLTFFVLTSNLNKAKTMEMAVPKESPIKSKINMSLANTILIDGNKKGILYYYAGKLSDSTVLFDLTMDPKKGVRETINKRNKEIQDQMNFLKTTYKSGKFSQPSYEKIKGYLTVNTQPSELDDELIKKNKATNYAEAMAHMDRDLANGEMTDTTFNKAASIIRNADNAPFFIIKWGGDATYGDVINIIDELKIGDVSKYALTKIDRVELEALSKKTGIHYPELDEPAPVEPTDQK